jgi:hypothetical protein
MIQKHLQSLTLRLKQQPEPTPPLFARPLNPSKPDLIHRLKGSRTMPRSNPTERAEVLLKETSLTAHEIAEMLGLDVYQVLGMKLKARTHKVRSEAA